MLLERGALSPNIRERRDASSALFDASGRPVPLAAGSVWIELLPVGRDLSWQ